MDFFDQEREAVPISELVPKILKTLKPKKKDPIDPLRDLWRENMPDFVRDHSRPLRLWRGLLTVLADSHASAYELTFYKQTILDILAQEGHSRQVKRIRFVTR